MKFDFLALAEASAEDSRGAITLVAINQNLVIAPALPAAFRRTAIAYVTEEDGDTPLPPGTPVSIAFRIESPSGKVIVAGTGNGALGTKPYPELPGAVQLAVDVVGTATEYGGYTLTCEVSVAANVITASRQLYVFPPPHSLMASRENN